jgi:hypothetical protein
VRGLDDPRGLAHATDALPATGELPGLRTDEVDPARAQQGEIGLGRRVAPHVDVHGGREEHRGPGRQKDRRNQVVGETMGHLRHQVRRGRSDDDELGPIGETDVVDLALLTGVEEIAAHDPARQALENQGRDESLGLRGQGTAHFVAGLPKRAQELGRLVGGDASRDREQDATRIHAARSSEGTAGENRGRGRRRGPPYGND